VRDHLPFFEQMQRDHFAAIYGELCTGPVA